jgi:hypothetical protein
MAPFCNESLGTKLRDTNAPMIGLEESGREMAPQKAAVQVGMPGPPFFMPPEPLVFARCANY